MNDPVIARLPTGLDWREHLGTIPDDCPSLVAFFEEPGRTEEPLLEVGYPEPNGQWTNAHGMVIEGVWAYAPLRPRSEIEPVPMKIIWA